MKLEDLKIGSLWRKKLSQDELIKIARINKFIYFEKIGGSWFFPNELGTISSISELVGLYEPVYTVEGFEV